MKRSESILTHSHLVRNVTRLSFVTLVFLFLQATALASQREVASLKDQYLAILQPMVEQLVSTQVTDPDDPDYGALVSPSTNPQSKIRGQSQVPE